MGCGASKSARVQPEDISIVDHPSRRSCEGASDIDRSRTVSEGGGGGGEILLDVQEDGARQNKREGRGKQESREIVIDPAYSAQSEIEAAVRGVITTPASSKEVATTASSSYYTKPPVTTITSSVDVDSPLHYPATVPASISPPQVFEVCMSADNRIEARAPVPGRLKKLESAPVVTKEMLEMKQYEVKERKKEEIKKKLERSRMSKKDRLMKEIEAAREMNSAENGEDIVLTESFSYSRLQEDKAQGEDGSRRVGRRKHSQKDYVNSSGVVEGDTQYNEEKEGDFWSSSQTEFTRPDSNTPKTDQSSENNNEQFM